MEKAEMKFVKPDNADIVTASGGGGGEDGLLHLSNFGNGKSDAHFTYSGNEIYKITTVHKPADLVTALNNALGYVSGDESAVYLRNR